MHRNRPGVVGQPLSPAEHKHDDADHDDAAVALAACLATVSPWTVRNCRTLERCALVSTNGGSNLAIGAVHRAHGGYLPVGRADGCVDIRGETNRDRCWNAVALAAIRGMS